MSSTSSLQSWDGWPPPRMRATAIMDEVDPRPRGIDGGGVGYCAWTGDADMAIAIRTGMVDHGDSGIDDSLDRVRVRAGAGIVADSDPASEFDETEQKM